LELGGFFLPQRSANFRADAAQFPMIARPFFNLNQQMEASQLTSFPGRFNGRLDVHAPSELWGLEPNVRCQLCCGCDWRVYLLGGARYLNLKESIGIVETIQGLAGAEPPFTNAGIVVADFFSTRNQFYGGQVGVEGRWRRGRWSVDSRVKVA